MKFITMGGIALDVLQWDMHRKFLLSNFPARTRNQQYFLSQIKTQQTLILFLSRVSNVYQTLSQYS